MVAVVGTYFDIWDTGPGNTPNSSCLKVTCDADLLASVGQSSLTFAGSNSDRGKLTDELPL